MIESLIEPEFFGGQVVVAAARPRQGVTKGPRWHKSMRDAPQHRQQEQHHRQRRHFHSLFFLTAERQGRFFYFHSVDNSTCLSKAIHHHVPHTRFLFVF